MGERRGGIWVSKKEGGDLGFFSLSLSILLMPLPLNPVQWKISIGENPQHAKNMKTRWSGMEGGVYIEPKLQLCTIL